jgi:hypothetical protein
MAAAGLAAAWRALRPGTVAPHRAGGLERTTIAREYGDAIVAGEPHIVWRRVGTYTIFDRP